MKVVNTFTSIIMGSSTLQEEIIVSDYILYLRRLPLIRVNSCSITSSNFSP